MIKPVQIVSVKTLFIVLCRVSSLTPRYVLKWLDRIFQELVYTRNFSKTVSVELHSDIQHFNILFTVTIFSKIFYSEECFYSQEESFYYQEEFIYSQGDSFYSQEESFYTQEDYFYSQKRYFYSQEESFYSQEEFFYSQEEFFYSQGDSFYS